ncbi:hypothetical protein SASPL_132708 [Salvia splendens]|uniref:Peptidase C1A papain C-terminal domain-containing protein n=1 Tax=Salvia splendens TaxID=180675 RepID=A0A8X8X3H5_SALSN|nr:hypothetical protein SASPL_132708 [Salvia splendens]
MVLSPPVNYGFRWFLLNGKPAFDMLMLASYLNLYAGIYLFIYIVPCDLCVCERTPHLINGEEAPAVDDGIRAQLQRCRGEGQQVQDFIDTFNAGENRSYTLAINEFADLTHEEFLSTRTGAMVGKGSARTSSAFMFWGGIPFQHIADNDGLSPDSDYIYEATDGSCSPERATSRAGKISGYENVPANDEAALLKAVANQPVSVVIDASGAGFRFHSSGVFTGECGTEMNHAVTVVGYGESSDGIKHWLVKNSWGSGWGEDGYVRIQRESGNVEGL